MKTVVLHGAKAAGRVALVDDEDYELVSQYKWYLWMPAPKPGERQRGPYAVANATINGVRRTGVRMHKMITGWPLTDHADRNGLNNQRGNLRPATKAQNGQNAMGHLGAASQFKGVTWLRGDRKWRAEITVEKRSRHLGRYFSEMEAALAYDAAARHYFGEYARTNFPARAPAETEAQHEGMLF